MTASRAGRRMRAADKRDTTSQEAGSGALGGPKARKTVSLALQGGGAHGAFTWGVLDALLADGRLAIEAISGTSAGAMNAVVLAEGFIDGGPEGARRQLETFWTRVSRNGRFSVLQRNLMQKLMAGVEIESTPGFQIMEAWMKMFSPYQTNPLDLNPLRGILDDLIDFERVRRCEDIKLFISATNVRSGKIKVFEGQELTPDHLAASACLPTLFQAVEIDGEHYWDGGFMGNPPLYPLFYDSKTDDVLLVQINPIERDEVPRSARDIQNRLTEITFNATLLRELRAVRFVTELVDAGTLSRESYKRVNMHRIDGGEALKDITAGSRMSTDLSFLERLREIGHAAGKAWLAANYDAIGVRSTLDLDAAVG
jgi:NTE family protein